MSRSAPLIVKLKKTHPDARIPALATPGAAGADLHAVLPEGVQERVIRPSGRLLVDTGIAAEVPPGWEIQIRPRSGLALKHGVTVLNGPGTIDSDFRDSLKVILVNHGEEPFEIRSGDRIAQMVVAEVPAWAPMEVEALSDTARGAGGFGSTGRGVAS
jgi:dUTP pyrophosphatase